MFNKYLYILSATALLALNTGCTLFDSSAQLGADHGMAPSSRGPTPEWYAKHYNRPRGIGEAIRMDRLALWDNPTGSYVYTIRGLITARYHPWQHTLKIKDETQVKEGTADCHWSADGALNANNTPASCSHLLNELAQELNVLE
ncbi:MAG: hypothetical protein FD130_2456 [Halothiobacillaceae bacterium]|nr:MAG: hypothetical protein FD130_2456 [Halothiobacillaceae bacterium]